MQPLATSVQQVARAFAQAEAGEIPDDPPFYAFTPSAMDPSLTPPGKQTLYLACPAYPGRLFGGRSWDDLADGEDERLLHRLVEVNLVDNAIKYSPEGGEIRVLLTADQDGALLSLTDRGIGLPQDALESVCEPFGRAANATQSNLPGMGLGFYIWRRIADAHGGRLWAESEGEGRGATVCLWLPVKEGGDHGPEVSGADDD